MQLNVALFLMAGAVLSAQTPPAPPIAPRVPPPAPRPERHPPEPSRGLVDFYRAQLELSAGTAAFEGSLSSSQKRVLEQMQEDQKKVDEASTHICAADETVARPNRGGEPWCVYKPVLTPEQKAAAHEALKKKLCDPGEDLDDTTNPNIPACVEPKAK